MVLGTNLRGTLAVPFLAALTVIPATASAATAGGPGAGMQGNNICVATPLKPGGTYQLGNLTVTNTGSGQETLTITIGPQLPLPPLHPPVSKFTRDAVPVPLSWVIVARNPVNLGPGGSTADPVTLTIPADAGHKQYESTLTATTAAAASGGGDELTTGAAADTYLKFSVDAAPPSCSVIPPPAPWWASQPSAGFRSPPGWHLGGPASQPFVWQYIPPADPPASSSGMPPGWNPRKQMQVWIDGGWDFVLGHDPGWQYLPDAGLGVVVYEPASGKLPSWALRLAAGESYIIPGTGARQSSAGMPPAAAAASAYSSAPAASSSSDRGYLFIALIVAAVLAIAAWRRRRRRARREARR